MAERQGARLIGILLLGLGAATSLAELITRKRVTVVALWSILYRTRLNSRPQVRPQVSNLPAVCHLRFMTINLRAPDERDLSFLFRADSHVGQEELRRVAGAGRVIVAVDDTGVQGWLRWGLFWDEIPFMNMVFVQEHRRGEGLGTRMIQHWENQQRVSGHDSVMTSTLANEQAQHLYRRLGYVDCGCLLLPGEPLEILFTKSLAG